METESTYRSPIVNSLYSDAYLLVAYWIHCDNIYSEVVSNAITSSLGNIFICFILCIFSVYMKASADFHLHRTSKTKTETQTRPLMRNEHDCITGLPDPVRLGDCVGQSFFFFFLSASVVYKRVININVYSMLIKSFHFQDRRPGCKSHLCLLLAVQCWENHLNTLNLFPYL